MPRPKSDYPLSETLLIRMDRRLRNQLERYAKNNNKKLATQAREALEKFIQEQKQIYDEKTNPQNPQHQD